MNDFKSLFLSKTVWGVFVALVATAVASVYHVKVGVEDQSTIVNIILGAIDAGASLFAIWGRVVATKQLTLTGSPGPLPRVPPSAALLVAIALGLALAAPPAHAQTKRVASPLINSLSTWADADIAAAAALAISIPNLEDPVGAACWKTWQAAGAVVKAHPLPLTLKLASDIQAARLVAMAIKKVCMDPNCSQVWNDITNQVAALSVLPIGFSLSTICAKIP
jgi:hypothetical protein